MNKIIYAHTCTKCRKLKRNKDLYQVADVVVCEVCFNDALEQATASQYYLLISIKVPLGNKPIDKDAIALEYSVDSSDDMAYNRDTF